jgi:ferredoxin-type protein NapG
MPIINARKILRVTGPPCCAYDHQDSSAGQVGSIVPDAGSRIMLDSDKPVNRRRFFREGLRELLKPLANAIEPLHEAARHLEQMDLTSAPGKPAAPRQIPLNIALRPPGALEEKAFRDTCSRCGECVRVCPAQCIKIDPNGVRANGAPYIDPNEMPCVVCDGLLCMPVCPTGALVPTILGEIDMGTAIWHQDTCVRTRGEDCTICVDKCPVGTFAIELIANDIHVKEAGCIGCGVCQFECPTSPKSIVIVPRSARPKST